eukprot:4448650-Ditylum_brightwellii.AAC.1
MERNSARVPTGNGKKINMVRLRDDSFFTYPRAVNQDRELVLALSSKRAQHQQHDHYKAFLSYSNM